MADVLFAAEKRDEAMAAIKAPSSVIEAHRVHPALAKYYIRITTIEGRGDVLSGHLPQRQFRVAHAGLRKISRPEWTRRQAEGVRRAVERADESRSRLSASFNLVTKSPISERLTSPRREPTGNTKDAHPRRLLPSMDAIEAAIFRTSWQSRTTRLRTA